MVILALTDCCENNIKTNYNELLAKVLDILLSVSYKNLSLLTFVLNYLFTDKIIFPYDFDFSLLAIMIYVFFMS